VITSVLCGGHIRSWEACHYTEDAELCDSFACGLHGQGHVPHAPSPLSQESTLQL
jgi:hypothetical protein